MNKMISWLDSELNEHTTVKSSSEKSCIIQKGATSARLDNVSESSGADMSLSVMQYPNPVTDNFRITVSSPDESIIELEIINQTGTRLVLQRIAPNVSVEVDASAFRSGVYFIKVMQKQKCSTLKIIKTN